MDNELDVYLIGIGGTAMGALAGLLKQLGHRVRGSDQHLYPPMSDKLREWEIPVFEGYDPQRLREPPPGLVIVGNVIRRDNPEATWAREAGLPTLSMAQAVARFGIGDKHSIVLAGTHGKTTTTALTAHVLEAAGRKPSFLVGGALVGYRDSFNVGAGKEFVIEGDEYDTAYFDKGSKFLHYKPATAVITSLEFDHADIFATIEDIDRAFASLIDLVPRDGHLVVWAGATRARALIPAHARCDRVTLYDLAKGPGVDLYCERFAADGDGIHLEPVLRGVSLGRMSVALWGNANATNVLAAIAALHGVGLTADEIRSGLASFRGVKRRMEVRGEPRGICVVDDFAHHPTAIRETLVASRQRWPDRRIWAVFEPRSATTRRNIFQDDIAEALTGADCVIVGSHTRLQEIPLEQRFDPASVAKTVRERGREAWAIADVAEIASVLNAEARPRDVVMVLSNGDFGGLHKLLLTQWSGPNA